MCDILCLIMELMRILKSYIPNCSHLSQLALSMIYLSSPTSTVKPISEPFFFNDTLIQLISSGSDTLPIPLTGLDDFFGFLHHCVKYSKIKLQALVLQFFSHCYYVLVTLRISSLSSHSSSNNNL